MLKWNERLRKLFIEVLDILDSGKAPERIVEDLVFKLTYIAPVALEIRDQIIQKRKVDQRLWEVWCVLLRENWHSCQRDCRAWYSTWVKTNQDEALRQAEVLYKKALKAKSLRKRSLIIRRVLSLKENKT